MVCTDIPKPKSVKGQERNVQQVKWPVGYYTLYLPVVTVSQTENSLDNRSVQKDT